MSKGIKLLLSLGLFGLSLLALWSTPEAVQVLIAAFCTGWCLGGVCRAIVEWFDTL